MTRDSLAAWMLPAGAGAAALLAIHGSHVIAASHGHVPWCLPWIDSCTSISATGRQLPEKLLFKPLVTTAALLLAATMVIAPRTLAVPGARYALPVRMLPACGLIAMLCILAYVAALGEAGQAARLRRRAGITLGFGFVFLAEAGVVAGLAALRRAEPARVPAAYWQALYGIVVSTLALGLLSVVLSLLMRDYDRIEDAFEWIFALLLNGWLVVLGLLWRHQGVVLAVRHD